MTKKALLVATVGGFVPQFEMNDVKLLRELGYEVHYAANFDVTMYDVDFEAVKKSGMVLHNICIQKSPAALSRNLKALRQLVKIINSERINLLHCHTPMGGVLARIAALLSVRSPRVIYTAHGFHFYDGAPVFNWIFYYPVERLLAHFTDVIVTINSEDYARANNFHLNSCGKAVKIPGVGLEPERFMHKGRNIREQLGVPDTAFHIVSIGELNENKNHKVVIEAIKYILDKKLTVEKGRNIYYTICGRGSSSERLKELTESLGLGEYINFAGYRSDVENILASADCFVFPSVREGLGMAALQAMAAGVAVIASDNRGTREYMNSGQNGLVCIQNTSVCFAKAIMRLYNNDELRKKLAENARKTTENFSLERTEYIMKSVYMQTE